MAAVMGTEFAHSTRAWRMSAAEFRAFQRDRPDQERWELIAGVPMMMIPPTLAHNRIAGTLEGLLNDALARHDPSRSAIQRPGFELDAGDYRPEPDVAVIDAEFEVGQRFVTRAYLLAEIVSRTDAIPVPGSDKLWIDVKREIYLAHDRCEAVLMIEQDRMEILLDVKSAGGWQSRVLGGNDELLLPGFGLRCGVKDLYRGTPLLPPSARRR
jgi:Uma2 family endonuclease